MRERVRSDDHASAHLNSILFNLFENSFPFRSTEQKEKFFEKKKIVQNLSNLYQATGFHLSQQQLLYECLVGPTHCFNHERVATSFCHVRADSAAWWVILFINNLWEGLHHYPVSTWRKGRGYPFPVFLYWGEAYWTRHWRTFKALHLRWGFFCILF